MYREALEKKKDFAKEAKARGKRIKLAKSPGREQQAWEAGLANIFGGVEADYKKLNLEGRRQLVRLDDDPIAYQSKYDLRLLKIDPSYDPKKGLAEGYTGTTFKDDPIYAKAKAETDAKEKALLDNIFDTDAKVDYNAYPGYLGKLKKEYDKTVKAFNVEGTTDEDKELMSQRTVRLRNVMEKITSGADPLDPELQNMARLALMGGKAKDLSSKAEYGKDAQLYAGRADILLRKARFAKDTKVGGGVTATTSMLPTKPAMTRPREPKADISMTESYKPEARTSIMDRIKELFKGGKKTSVADELDEARRESLMAFIPKINDFFSAMFSRSANVMHNGGKINKTGKIFAEKGEYILPKGFAGGGQVESESASMGLNTSIVKLDASDILQKLESIELKVEDKELKIEVDETTIPKITVEQPDWQVEVNVPSDTVNVAIDLGTAASELTTAVETALKQTVKVEVTGITDNAVGGEKFDQLAKTVSDVNEKLINVKIELEGKINMLGTANNETIDIDRQVVSVVDTRLIAIQEDLNDIRTAVGSVSSTQRQKGVYYDSKFDELDRRLNNTMNITGIGTGGILN